MYGNCTNGLPYSSVVILSVPIEENSACVPSVAGIVSEEIFKVNWRLRSPKVLTLIFAQAGIFGFCLTRRNSCPLGSCENFQIASMFLSAERNFRIS